MTSLRGEEGTKAERTRNDGSWPNGMSPSIELELCYAGGDNRGRRRNSRSRLKPNDRSSNSSSTNSDCREMLPAELQKTSLCFFAMLFVFFCNLFFTGTIHDRTPTVLNDNQKSYPPLHDIGLSLSMRLDVDRYKFLTISEIVLVVTTAFVVFILCFHKYRSIVFRRMFFLLTLLFAVRLISINVTMLPISSSSLFRCENKSENFDGGLLVSRFLDLVSSCGLANVKYCGNYVYSGHTVMFVFNCLMVGEYCPSWIINLPLKIVSACGLACILISQYDYTISIITAYYLTTRLFWVYHTIVNNSSLKYLNDYSVNQICKEWWYPLFKFLEGNVKSVVPSMQFSFR